MTGNQSRMYRSSLKHSLIIRAAIASLALAALIGSASADEPSVTAVLTSSEAAVGQAVGLQIQVKGDRNAAPPSEISVEGLEIHSTGQMQSFEMRNFNVTSSTTFNYTILPLRAGRFTIPPQTLRAGSNSLQTPELTLNVTDSLNQSSQSNPAGSTADPRKNTFAELIVPKTTAYVGEMIPIVVRIGLEIHVRLARTLPDEFDLSGQGLTKQKMRASEAQQTIGGKTYHIVTYKTAIAAVRTGPIEIGPVELPAVIMVPQSSRNRSFPQNPLNLDDPALDNFFNDPWLMATVPREIKLTTERVNIEVKALPPNAPPTFGGAVGNFTMTSDANPKSVQVGDPITVTAKISGRGNFDRVTAPAFEDEHGWHKYPPSADFKQDDDVGISGTKTFETVLSPNERKVEIPAPVFTYFDSFKEQYVTLRGDPIPVQVEGAAAPAATPPVSASQAPAPAASPSAVPKQQDILHQLTEISAAPQSFAPLVARRSFWLAQLIPLLALLGYVGWKMRQARLDNREARRREALQREARELQRMLRRDDASPQEYFSRASRAVQLKTALAKNLDPNTVDAELAALAFHADEETRLRLRHLFEKSDEVRYSGSGQNGIRLVPPETRNEVLDLIENLRG
ncbi:MAG TPA: BatD family protein [Chthoniobacterales bacterium]